MSPNDTALVILPVEAGNSLLETAEMEFQATLQLLADRACWVSGAHSAEIALEDEGELRYAAVSGGSEREPGAKAAYEEAPIRQCLVDNRTARSARASACCMAVPVDQDGEAIGFLGLTSEREFSPEDEAAAARVAELVGVAVQHRDAARRAEKLEFKEGELELPSLWSAPENIQPQARAVEHQKASGVSATDVGTCTACGFPVSPNRSLCVECELKPEASVAAQKPLFKSEPEESWLGAHGYAIASLVVTALTVAILLWLRH